MSETVNRLERQIFSPLGASITNAVREMWIEWVTEFQKEPTQQKLIWTAKAMTKSIAGPALEKGLVDFIARFLQQNLKTE